jgi:hypothetical protein
MLDFDSVISGAMKVVHGTSLPPGNFEIRVLSLL